MLHDTAKAAIAGGRADASHPSVFAGWWATLVFFLLYSLSFADRQLLNLLVEPIKQHLQVSDFQISLLQGFTFAIFYTVFGLGIGWLVDNRPRRPLVAIGVILWSFAAASCGLAGRYWHLALARVGVAVGEASLAPAAYSLMSDIFPAKRLALPMSVMGSGAPLGGALALIAGSFILGVFPDGLGVPVLGHLQGWQVAFVAVGLPGLLLAPLVMTVADPGRRTEPAVSGAARSNSNLREVLAYLIENRRFYFGHFLGFGVYSMINYAITAWLPTFLIRRHHWDLGQAGYAVGFLIFAISIPGSLLMGWLVDRWYNRGRRDAHLRFFAGCAILQMLSVVAAVSANSPWLALGLLVPQVAVACFTGVAAASLQIVTPSRMRGQVSAMFLLVFNLLGLGLGPSIAAVFTDFVFADETRVGSSLVLTFVLFAPIATGLMLSAAPAMRQRLTDASGT